MGRASLLLLFTLTASACDPGFKPPGYSADAPVHTCVGFSDPYCDASVPSPEPRSDRLSPEAPLALGAKIGVLGGTALTPTRIAPVKTDVFVAQAVGVGAILDGHDVTHFEVRAPVDIRVTHENVGGTFIFNEIFGTDAFTLRIPDRFRAVAIDAEGTTLAGDLGCSWTSNNPSVVSVDTDPGKNVVEFTIHGPGQATLHVTLGSLGKDIPFNVK